MWVELMGTLGSRWPTAYLFLSYLEYLCNSGGQIGTSEARELRTASGQTQPFTFFNRPCPFLPPYRSLRLEDNFPLFIWQSPAHPPNVSLQITSSRKPSQHPLPPAPRPHQAGLGDLSPLEQSSCISIAHLWTHTHPT